MKSIRLIWVWEIRVTLAIRNDAGSKFKAIVPFVNKLLGGWFGMYGFPTFFNKSGGGYNFL